MRRLFAGLLLTTVSVLAPALSPATTRHAGAAPYSAGHYTVSGSTLLDPNGARFVIRGADAVYGRFSGGDSTGYGAANYNGASAALLALKNAGYNWVRLDADANQWADSTQTPSGSEFITELENVVAMAETDGLVVEISQEANDDSTTSLTNAANLLTLLGNTYKSDPNIILKLENEPLCGNQQTACTSATDPADPTSLPNWQAHQSQLDAAVRSTGYANPVVVNCISWSWNCSQYPSYAVQNNGVVDTNVILGTHGYANGDSDFRRHDQADAQANWGNLTSLGYVVMVDEFGNEDGTGDGVPDGSDRWNEGFCQWIVGWTTQAAAPGSGVVAFVDYWSDANTMLDDPPNATWDNWSRWGQRFLTSCVQPLATGRR